MLSLISIMIWWLYSISSFYYFFFLLSTLYLYKKFKTPVYRRKPYFQKRFQENSRKKWKCNTIIFIHNYLYNNNLYIIYIEKISCWFKICLTCSTTVLTGVTCNISWIRIFRIFTLITSRTGIHWRKNNNNNKKKV